MPLKAAPRPQSAKEHSHDDRATILSRTARGLVADCPPAHAVGPELHGAERDEALRPATCSNRASHTRLPASHEQHTLTASRAYTGGVTFQATALIGFFLGFAFGVGCALAVMYSIYSGGYRAAVRDAALPESPARLVLARAKLHAGRADSIL